MFPSLLTDRRVIAVVLLSIVVIYQVLTQRSERPPENSPRPAASAPGAISETGEDEEEGNLAREERQGGHLIRKHVGQTRDQLRARLERERNISAASSFSDLPTAEAAVDAALEANRDRIDQWLAGSSPRFVVNYTSPNNVGITMRRGDEEVQTTRRLRLVLVRDGRERDGYRILTGYPTP